MSDTDSGRSDRPKERVAVWRVVERCDACNAQVDPGDDNYVTMCIYPDWLNPERCRGKLILCKTCFRGLDEGNPHIATIRPESKVSP